MRLTNSNLTRLIKGETLTAAQLRRTDGDVKLTTDGARVQLGATLDAEARTDEGARHLAAWALLGGAVGGLVAGADNLGNMVLLGGAGGYVGAKLSGIGFNKQTQDYQVLLNAYRSRPEIFDATAHDVARLETAAATPVGPVGLREK